MKIGRVLNSRKTWHLTEELPPHSPESRGMGFTTRTYYGADHAGDSITWRSRVLNSALAYWLSKKQTGIDTNSFGSNFMAIKHCIEYLPGLRYEPQMMGIPVDDTMSMYGDNQSVLNKTSRPQSTLKKMLNIIADHFLREGYAPDEWRTM
jgi:hypothetical protein